MNIGAVLGLLTAVGLLLFWSALPFRNRPALADRLAPYVGERPQRTGGFLAADRTYTPLPALERLMRPYVMRAAATLERILGGGRSVQRRLHRAGREISVHDFRVEQLVWAGGGCVFGVVVGLALVASGSASVAVPLIICAAAAIGGLTACDYRLSRRVRVRERQISAEFPTIADLLALAVTAGEGPMAALERVAASSQGELARELRKALGDARLGAGLVDALDGVAERAGVVALARFADGVAVAMERGTPLADVLRAQAADVRAAHKRSLLEIGGRKEIGMLIPVVFLVLPVTVVFALYPGLVQISAVVP